MTRPLLVDPLSQSETSVFKKENLGILSSAEHHAAEVMNTLIPQEADTLLDQEGAHSTELDISVKDIEKELSKTLSKPLLDDKRAQTDLSAAKVKNKKRSKVGKKLAKTMMGTVGKWALIEEGDRIMVCLSGGKDSYTLFDLLCQAQKKAPFRFEIIGVHLDQTQPGYDGRSLESWLQEYGAPFEIIKEDTYSIVKDKTQEKQAYCVMCSRLRRGILYGAAERLGCNKLAMGHHRDDALETLMLNLLYSGKMQAMPATYTTDDNRFDVIRPLIDCAEKDIIVYAEEQAYPILPCNLCGSQDGLKRERVKALLNDLEKESHDVRSVMHHALQNVRPTHLLDKEVRDVWLKRDSTVRPHGDDLQKKETCGGDVKPKLGDVKMVKKNLLKILPK